MTKNKVPILRFYWDSCVFLSAINGNPDRTPIIKAILEDCEEGNVEIYTSMLSITEVAFAETEKASNILDSEVENNIDALWLPPSPIKLIEIHEFILRDAKKLMRLAVEKGFSLKPADAIHLTTAQRIELNEIHTYDPKWLKYQDLVKHKIKEPNTERLPFPVEDDKAKPKE